MCSPAIDLRKVLDDTDPELYKSTKYYRKNDDVEDIYKNWDLLVADPVELANLTAIVKALVADPPSTGRELEAALMRQRKIFRATYRKAQLLHAYNLLVGNGEIQACRTLQQLLVKKSSKSQSGVLVITVLTSPYPQACGLIPAQGPRRHRGSWFVQPARRQLWSCGLLGWSLATRRSHVQAHVTRHSRWHPGPGRCLRPPPPSVLAAGGRDNAEVLMRLELLLLPL